MMSFYRRSVNSLLGTLATTTTTEDSLPLIPPPPHPVVCSPTSPPPEEATSKKAGGTGYLRDQMGGSSISNGLMSCTESLGFESSDETTLDSVGNSSSCTEDARSIVTKGGGGADEGRAMVTQKPRTVGAEARATAAKKELMRSRKKNFPPPLSCLNSKGQRNFVLRSVRRDGRLEIMNEVTIHSPPSEIMFATRQDGRLRLHLIKTVDDNIIEEEEEEEETETEAGKKELVSQKICTTVERQQPEEGLIAEDDLTNEENHHEGEEEEEERVVVKTGTNVSGDGGEWKLCGGDGGGDGSRRCYSSYFVESMHLWTRPCVTTS